MRPAEAEATEPWNGPIARLRYTPGFDGLRAVSVLAVVLVHSWPQFPGYPVRVDTFFVLSGFLITWKFLEEWSASGRINVRNFYIRRFLRLAPALWAMLAGTFLVFAASGMSAALSGNLQADALGAVFYVSNWTQALGLRTSVLYGQTWSLSLEEQFYVAWAAALPFCLRRWGIGRTRSVTLAAILVLGLYRTSLVLWGASAARVYFGFDTHVDACLAGCLLALCLAQPRVPEQARAWFARLRYAPEAAVLGLVAVSALATIRKPQDVAMFVPVDYLLSAVIIASIFLEVGLVRKILQWPILVRIGTISYGIYLWHYPLMMGIRYAPRFLPPSQRSALLLGLCGGIAMASVSYRLIERPCLRLRSRFPGARVRARPPRECLDNPIPLPASES